MKHIFLTGDIQCGKSTLIQSILQHGAGKLVTAGGFLTYFTNRETKKTLYLGDASIYGTLFQTAASPYVSPLALHHALANANLPPAIAAEFDGETRPQIHLETFNSYGHTCIEHGLAHATELSKNPAICPILVFDECGYLESSAADFQQAILCALDMPFPILGVVRQMNTPSWLTSIQNHPNTELITVTQKNRDALTPQLTNHFLSSL